SDSTRKKCGKLLKKGEPDISTVSKMVLNDWLRGKIPYFTPPPENDDNDKTEETNTEKAKNVEQIFHNIHVTTQFLPDDLNKSE
ncbi:6253_t:CDS:2, partial [Racocetra persica]